MIRSMSGVFQTGNKRTDTVLSSCAKLYNYPTHQNCEHQKEDDLLHIRTCQKEQQTTKDQHCGRRAQIRLKIDQTTDDSENNTEWYQTKTDIMQRLAFGIQPH